MIIAHCCQLFKPRCRTVQVRSYEGFVLLINKGNVTGATSISIHVSGRNTGKWAGPFREFTADLHRNPKRWKMETVLETGCRVINIYLLAPVLNGNHAGCVHSSLFFFLTLLALQETKQSLFYTFRHLSSLNCFLIEGCFLMNILLLRSAYMMGPLYKYLLRLSTLNIWGEFIKRTV